MTTNIALLIEILDSLGEDWEYASPIRQKIESGNISSEEIAELTSILWNAIQHIDTENVNIEMENSLFRKYLLQVEEAGTRKSENETVETLLMGL